MNRNVEDPITTASGRPGDEERTTTTHPAFAQISASRVSGLANLYGSDFAHQSYVRIRVNPSEMHRSLANDWPHAGRTEYIEVDLSEAQWASFVSSLNIGSGTQCTLRSNNGEQIPDLPAPASRVDQFAAEMKVRVQRALDEVSALEAEINELKISEKAKASLRSRVAGAHRELVSNTGFVAKQFDEHMEQTVEKAKIEVNAYATNTLMRAGLEAVKKPMIEYAAQSPREIAMREDEG